MRRFSERAFLLRRNAGMTGRSLLESRPYQRLELISRNRFGIQKALGKITTHGDEKISLLGRLHPFGNDLQSHFVSQHDHRLAKRLIVFIEGEVLYE